MMYMAYGYPSDIDLDLVKEWEGRLSDWFAYCRSLWWRADWGWREERAIDEIDEKPVTRYRISTGGWSGNEDIIEAMQHSLGWFFTWVQSRRGGHYIFEIPDALADFELKSKESADAHEA